MYTQIPTLEEQKKLFSARFRSLHKEGQSQTDFAASLGIARATVITYERGERLPDCMSLLKIAMSQGVTTDWLLGLTDDPKAKPSAVDDLKLTPSSVENLKSIVQEYDASIMNYLLESILFHDAMYNANMAFIYRDIAEDVPEELDIFSDGFSDGYERMCDEALKYGTLPVQAEDVPGLFLKMAGDCLSTAITELEEFDVKTTAHLVNNENDYGEYNSVHEFIYHLEDELNQTTDGQKDEPE